MSKKYKGGLKFGSHSPVSFKRNAFPDHSDVSAGPMAPTKFDLGGILGGNKGGSGWSVTSDTSDDPKNLLGDIMGKYNKKDDGPKIENKSDKKFDTNMKDFPLGSQERVDEYRKRDWAQDDTTTGHKDYKANVDKIEPKKIQQLDTKTEESKLSEIEMPTTTEDGNKKGEKDGFFKKVGKSLKKAADFLKSDELVHFGRGLAEHDYQKGKSIMGGYMDSKNKQRQLDEQSQANKQIAVTRDIKNQALQDKQDLFHKQNIEGEKFGELPNAKKFAGGRFGGGYVEFDDGTNYKETLDLSSEGKPESLIKDYKAFNKDFTSGSYSYLDDPDFEHTKTEQKKLKD